MTISYLHQELALFQLPDHRKVLTNILLRDTQSGTDWLLTYVSWHVFFPYICVRETLGVLQQHKEKDYISNAGPLLLINLDLFDTLRLLLGSNYCLDEVLCVCAFICQKSRKRRMKGTERHSDQREKHLLFTFDWPNSISLGASGLGVVRYLRRNHVFVSIYASIWTKTRKTWITSKRDTERHSNLNRNAPYF